MKSGIYRIINLINGHSYIGSAVRLSKRKEKHFRLLKNNTHANPYLQNAFNLYKAPSFMFDVLEYCEPGRLIEREQFWIDSYKSQGEVLYNIRLIAQSNFGLKASEETKNRMSIALSGRRFSDEHKRKLSESGMGKHTSLKGRPSPMKGRHHTKEAKIKLSESNKGKNTWMKGMVFSDETRKRMSKAQKMRWENKKVNNLTKGIQQ